MDRDRWRRVEELFHQAAELPPPSRDGFLSEACGDDERLREQVGALLASDGATTSPGAAGTAADELRPGRRIGPYTLLREIGRGGMGTVYVAGRADEGFERRMALKILRHGPLSEELRARFDRERRILARLEHPSIARLLDGGTTAEGVPYLVLELVDGEPIDRWCEARDLPLRRRLELFREVCVAVGSAHRKLVVHRDLKPSNILVGQDGRPKLLDFGISELPDSRRGEDEDEDSLRPLTPGYASPEQLAGSPVSTASDVFSLGVVLYELLAGRLPFRPEQLVAMAFEGVAPEPAPLPRDLTLRFAGDVESILCKALATRPEDRYRSVDDLADDISRYLHRRPVRARPGSWSQRAVRFAARHRWSLGGALVLAALVAGLLVAMTLLAVERSRQRDRMRVERDRAQATAEFLNSVFVETGRFSEHSQIGEILEQEGERVLEWLGVDPETRATTSLELGRLLTSLGRYDAARGHLEKAVSLRRMRSPPEPVTLAEAEHHLARLFLEAGEYGRAEELERSALDLLAGAGPEVTAQRARSLSNLGWLLGLRGEHDEARRRLQEALLLTRDALGEGHPEVADRLEAMAFVATERGDGERALALYRDAVAIRREAVPADPPALAMNLKNLGTAEMAMEHLEPAAAALVEALEIETEVFGEDHPATAGTLDKLAALRMLEGDLESASHLLPRVLEIRRQTLGEIHPRVAETLARQAELFRLRGDLAAASDAAERSLTVARASMPEGSPMLAFPLQLLGRTELERGEPAWAEAPLREALALRRATLPPDSSLISSSLNLLAACLAETGRPAEARALLVESVERLRSNGDGRDPLLSEALDLLAGLPDVPDPEGTVLGAERTAQR